MLYYLYEGDMMIGTDFVYIPRLKKMIDNSPSFIKKVYTEKELAIASTIKDPINFLATRFAAKEAIIKATKTKFDFKEIEILKGSLGEPIPAIINHLEYQIDLSLSYDNDYAIAFCLIK